MEIECNDGRWMVVTHDVLRRLTPRRSGSIFEKSGVQFRIRFWLTVSAAFRCSSTQMPFFLIYIVGGWSRNWAHSARRPLTGLLYLPRVIVRMENLVE
jgi:hypothetical protein